MLQLDGCDRVLKASIMNTTRWLLISAVASLFTIFACAGPSAKRHPSVSNPPPLVVASAETEGISAEEALLLDPDFFEDEEDEQSDYMVADPLEGFNRAMFYVNDKLYFWVIKPIAVGYGAVAPEPARVGLKNFIYNLKAPLRIINNILQGKGQGAEAEVARFLYNTSVGVLGFGNPARKHAGLDPPDEDLGQTLGRWGVGPGFFLMIPGIGPTTLRDTAGMAGDYYLNPINHYIDSFGVSLAIWAGTAINDVSLRIGDYETLKNAALDPYQAFRNGYMQLREARIKE